MGKRRDQVITKLMSQKRGGGGGVLERWLITKTYFQMGDLLERGESSYRFYGNWGYMQDN